MTEPDDRLRHDLATLAAQMPASDITDESVRRGQQRKLRRTTILATTGVAIVVAAVVVPLTVIGRSASEQPSVGTRPNVAPSRTTSVGGASGVSRPPWQVAAPLLSSVEGPLTPHQRRCTSGEITATARTRTTSSGVAGVVTLTGSHCSIPISQGPTKLLAVNGARLAVRSTAMNPQDNPGQNIRPDIALADGQAIWGFSWSGSWCGPAARSIVLRMNDPHTDSLRPIGAVHATLSGPQPACQGASSSTLTAGAAGLPSEPVLPPPTAWSGLTAHLEVAPTTDGNELTHLVATLRNSTDRAISLDPCPSYAMEFTSHISGFGNKPTTAGVEENGSNGSFGCRQPAMVVPANGELAIHLPDRAYDAGTSATPHSIVTIRFAIAGVPTAIARSRVR
jgi:hypothetical protein